MKLNKLLSICLGITLAFSVSANDLSEARIYINPGHGGWGPNDRPMATINYAQMDTLGFFETNTNLIKGMALREELVKAGAGYVRMSRTVNGVVSADDEHKTENDKYIETQPGESGTQQLVTLSVICQDVEANNMDYFISIHSNAATEGSSTNYPLILYRGTDSESGNGLTNARDMARAAWPYVNKNEVTYKSYYTGENDNNSRGDISFYGSSSSNSMGYSRVPTRPMPSRSLPEGSAHSSGVNLRTFSRPSFSARRSFIPPSALSKLVCMEYAEISLRTRVRTIRPIASDSVTLDSG